MMNRPSARLDMSIPRKNILPGRLAVLQTSGFNLPPARAAEKSGPALSPGGKRMTSAQLGSLAVCPPALQQNPDEGLRVSNCARARSRTASWCRSSILKLSRTLNRSKRNKRTGSFITKCNCDSAEFLRSRSPTAVVWIGQPAHGEAGFADSAMSVDREVAAAPSLLESWTGLRPGLTRVRVFCSRHGNGAKYSAGKSSSPIYGYRRSQELWPRFLARSEQLGAFALLP